MSDAHYRLATTDSAQHVERDGVCTVPDTAARCSHQIDGERCSWPPHSPGNVHRMESIVGPAATATDMEPSPDTSWVEMVEMGDYGKPADTFFAARANLWNDEAKQLVTRIEEYEETHPADSLCLAPALAAARCCAYGDGVEHTR